MLAVQNGKPEPLIKQRWVLLIRIEFTIQQLTDVYVTTAHTSECILY